MTILILGVIRYLKMPRMTRCKSANIQGPCRRLFVIISQYDSLLLCRLITGQQTLNPGEGKGRARRMTALRKKITKRSKTSTLPGMPPQIECQETGVHFSPLWTASAARAPRSTRPSRPRPSTRLISLGLNNLTLNIPISGGMCFVVCTSRLVFLTSADISCYGD